MSIPVNNNFRDASMVIAGSIGVIHLATTAYKGVRETVYQIGREIFHPDKAYECAKLIGESGEVNDILKRGTNEYLTKYKEMFPDNTLYLWDKKTLVLSVISLATVYFGYHAFQRLSSKKEDN